MRWDRLFEDLQDQFASEWEAERAALDTEAERLRLTRLPLRARLAALAHPAGPEIAVEVGEDVVRGRLTAVGEDWAGLAGDAVGILRLDAVRAVTLEHADLLRSARAEPARPATLAERMGFGFVLRDLARRRVGVVVHGIGGGALSGTIDRAAADHLDLAVHDAGSPRRAGEVTGFRVIPFTAVTWVRMDAGP
ncbi:MAG: hypothetical protein QM626_06940 [Microbacterium sp.]|uniref:hypothetical protein n=1 Tax=Microbacterium sp. TaxID=51671 RepID=UPI0039E60571